MQITETVSPAILFAHSYPYYSSFSPALLERYMSIARHVSRLAVGNVNIKPSVEEISARRDAPGTTGEFIPELGRGGVGEAHGRQREPRNE